MTFTEHKKKTVEDCKAIIDRLNELMSSIEQGDMKAFEEFWIEGGTEEGDAKIMALRELLILRYCAREEKIK